MEINTKTKFSIGDKVFYAHIIASRVNLPCPDCNDEKVWQIKTPSGQDFTCACQRCSSWSSNISYHEYSYNLSKLTIGQVEYTKKIGPDAKDEARYMCLETGVGGGSVYRDDQLFATEQEAEEAAKKQVALNYAKNPQPGKLEITTDGTSITKVDQLRWQDDVREGLSKENYGMRNLLNDIEGWLEATSENTNEEIINGIKNEFKLWKESQS